MSNADIIMQLRLACAVHSMDARNRAMLTQAADALDAHEWRTIDEVDEPFCNADGASIYLAPRGWFADDGGDWLAGPYASAAKAAWVLYHAVKRWEDNYEPSEAELTRNVGGISGDAELRHQMAEASKLK